MTTTKTSQLKHFTFAALWLAIGCSADADLKDPNGSAGASDAAAQPGSASPDGADGSTSGVAPVQPGASPPKGCAAVSQTAQNRRQPADIIIGVDTSGSMGQEAMFVQQNMNAFSQQIVDSGVDVRVVVVAAGQSAMTMGGGPMGGRVKFGICIGPPLGSGTCPLDANPPRYAHIDRQVGSNDVLGVLVDAYPSYKGQLRQDSVKHFVSVTDDDATEPPINTVEGFVSAVMDLEPGNAAFWSGLRYSSIYCFTACQHAAAIGAIHRDLVMRTGGVGGDLCQQDFKPVFDELAKQVVADAALACDWSIPAPPGTQRFDKSLTNVQLTLDEVPTMLGRTSVAECGRREGWHYDDEATPTRVHACPATCTRIKAAKTAQVDILFGCTTVLL